MTQGLARVEELFEARNPKLEAEISDLNGIVQIEHIEKNLVVKIVAQELYTEEYYYDDETFDIAVKVGQKIKAKQILARSKKDKQKVNGVFAGEIKKIEAGVITVVDIEPRVAEYKFAL